jgi:nucleoside-diphosphate-sugar epimerase
MNQDKCMPPTDTQQGTLKPGLLLAPRLEGTARPPLKVLVLGGSGFLGQRLLHALADCPGVEALGASRRASVGPIRTAGVAGKAESRASTRWRELDSCDLPSVRAALTGMDAVVNCVAGSATAIAEGARVLVQAALQAGRPRIVHLSSQAVYGAAEGWVRANAVPDPDPGLGWYGRAKCQAEAQLRRYAGEGGQSMILRPGCIHGPGSQLWVGRIGRWLQAGRLGDLGAAGDGWSNLVHVDDVVSALMAALWRPLVPGEQPVWNLAAPDSPRWNQYFVDLALALDATPVRRLGRQLRLDAWLAGPPLKLAEIALQKIASRTASDLHLTGRLPEAIPPGLLRLWRQELRLDSRAATQLGLRFMPYEASLTASAQWFAAQAQQQQNQERQHDQEKVHTLLEAARAAPRFRADAPPSGTGPAPEKAGYP